MLICSCSSASSLSSYESVKYISTLVWQKSVVNEPHTTAFCGSRQLAINFSVCGRSCFTNSKPKPRLHPVKNTDRASMT